MEFDDFDEEPQSFAHSERISISIAQNHGRFRRAIPCLPIVLAHFCCLCNIVLPGLGTFWCAVSLACCTSDPREGTRHRAIAINLFVALLQFLSFPLIIGWVWSIVWGVLFIQIARKWWIASIDNRRSAVDCCFCSRW